MKKKILMLISICILTIGFAAVTTSLSLTGDVVLENTVAMLDTDITFLSIQGSNAATITNSRRTFEVPLAFFGNDSSSVKYVIGNSSQQYDATISVVCTSGDSLIDNRININTYFVDNNSNSIVLPGGHTVAGILKISNPDSLSATITCSISYSPLERTTLANFEAFEILDDDESGTVNVGDTVNINGEGFYVISNNNGHIVALAKYNLNTSSGLQYKDNTTGGVAFSNSRGWPYTNNEDINIKNYGGPVKTALYDVNTGYEKYLQANVPTATVRLITKTELENLGCISSSFTCTGAPAWIYSTSYWTGTASEADDGLVSVIISDGAFRRDFYNESGYGVRPVVEFDVTPTYRIVNDLNSNGILDIGDEIAIGNEHFYVISNNGTTLNALAKYNLYVGNEVDSSSYETTPLTSPTGIQSPTAVGWVDGAYTWIGTVAFSDSNGWPYANNADINIKGYDGPVKTALYDETTGYEKYLQATVPTATVRLITKTELEDLGCSLANNSCTGAPAWVYSTSYWSGSAYSNYDDYVWYVYSSGGFGRDEFGTDGDYGVRPVVTLSV